MDSMEARKQRLQQAFAELDTQRAILENCTLQWKSLSDHYASLEQALQKKFQELVEKEKALELKTKETEALLDRREHSIENNEQNYIARAEEKKKSALEAIENGGENDDVLKLLCQKMDAEGLWKYMAEHRKDIQSVRVEFPKALECAVDPARLVVEAIEGLYKENSEENRNGNKKHYLGLADRRRACTLLLESLVPVVADPVLGEDRPVVAEGLKQRAKVVADEWKAKIDADGGPENAKPLEVQAFLQLVATFGIGHEFESEDLRKLVVAASSRRQVSKLCGALRISEIMPVIVEELVSKGKQIDAVYFVQASGLSEKFPPVGLLEAYLKNSKKATVPSLKNGNNSAAMNEANNKELTSLKAVIKCIEEHNLQSDFSPESLQNRVVELERKKAEKKKSGHVPKSQNKRPRLDVLGSAPLAKSGRFSNAYGSSHPSDRSIYRSADRAQNRVAPAGVSPYRLPGQSIYNRSGQGMYGSSYGGASRSPVSLSNSYPYQTDDIGVSLRGSGSYGNYHHGSGVPSAYQSSW